MTEVTKVRRSEGGSSNVVGRTETEPGRWVPVVSTSLVRRGDGIEG